VAVAVTGRTTPAPDLGAPLLTGEGLVLEFGAGERRFRAVDGADISVRELSFVAVVGPSGSGKSSLLYLLSGLKAPGQGRVLFRDQDYARMGDLAVTALRRREFGFIFQQHFLVNYLGCVENVLVGALRQDAASRDWAVELLERLGLGGKLGQRPYQLSVGERQRVAVARAMVSRPAVIFADEPTASLDQRTGHEVIRMLGEYREHGAVMVVTHDMGMTSGCDAIMEMHDGHLAKAAPSAAGRP
jgi:putative ABC transport system ATP-binding protein